MATSSESKSYSRRSIGAMLLVGVLAGVTVGGGVGVFAASSTKTVTVCVDKIDNHMNYSKDSKCKSHQYKVVLNQKGVAGAKGDTGAAGVAGAKGDTGAAGVAGAKGDTGAAGASSPTGFTARSVCGPNGTTLCAVGVQGPGGGTIVYVDSTNEMLGYDYLEVAPEDASIGVAWSTATMKCGSTAGVNCQTKLLSDAGTALGYIGLGTGRAATAAIIARHNAGGVDKNLYAAGIADAYTTTKASDWFLPSKDELNEVCKYATNQATGAGTVCSGGTVGTDFNATSYWSSSEYGMDEVLEESTAWVQYFVLGFHMPAPKTLLVNVRPVRAF
jgi:hypothetical protein